MGVFLGRKACTEGLGLSEVGVKLQPRTGKVIVDEQDATSQKNIFAIGDVADVSLNIACDKFFEI